MKIKFKELNKTVYGTTMLWGITGDIVKKAEKWRKVFKSARYAVCGAKTFLCTCRLKNYVCQIEYMNDSGSSDKRTEQPEHSKDSSSEEEKVEGHIYKDHHSKHTRSARSIQYELQSMSSEFGDSNKEWLDYDES
mmetsp:Transcript_8568/g.7597  ORF Transcript_8568/g.7597 Transcript_8568/m.7597 type:complete len:135 (-) Transcript_8568:12-416(-)